MKNPHRSFQTHHMHTHIILQNEKLEFAAHASIMAATSTSSKKKDLFHLA